MSEIIKSLIEGNKQFRKKFFDDKSSHFRELVLQGQKPKALVVTCSDSRVNPNLIFSCKPGDLFTIRNVGALVPPCGSKDNYPATGAALEFGICSLKVKQVILLGHSHCGGIESLVQGGVEREGQTSASALAKWLSLVQPLCKKVMTSYPRMSVEDQVTVCTQSALVSSLEHLMSYPWIKRKVEEEELFLHAWYFSLMTGGIDRYDQQKECWMSCSPEGNLPSSL